METMQRWLPLAAGLGARGTGEPGGLQLTFIIGFTDGTTIFWARRKQVGTREAGMA